MLKVKLADSETIWKKDTLKNIVVIISKLIKKNKYFPRSRTIIFANTSKYLHPDWLTKVQYCSYYTLDFTLV